MWGQLLETARTLEALPLWLQYFPKILFQVINKSGTYPLLLFVRKYKQTQKVNILLLFSGSQKISKEELRAFYTMFLGIDFRVVNETLDSIYNAMTDVSVPQSYLLSPTFPAQT